MKLFRESVALMLSVWRIEPRTEHRRSIYITWSEPLNKAIEMLRKAQYDTLVAYDESLNSFVIQMTMAQRPCAKFFVAA